MQRKVCTTDWPARIKFYRIFLKKISSGRHKRGNAAAFRHNSNKTTVYLLYLTVVFIQTWAWLVEHMVAGATAIQPQPTQ